jgi:hypothetical protein
MSRAVRLAECHIKHWHTHSAQVTKTCKTNRSHRSNAIGDSNDACRSLKLNSYRMDELLKQSGFYFGNALLSGMGLVFAVGAPAIAELKPAKAWWVVLWSGLLGFYLWSVLLASINVVNVLASAPLAIFNAISTAAAAMLFFHLGDKWLFNQRKAAIICSVIFALVLLSGLLSLFINHPVSRYLPAGAAAIPGQVLSWVFFVMLAWTYRKQHMGTTLLLLAYANLQLPAGLIGKQGWGNDFVLLLAAKLSLIGAMYHTLGVRDGGSGSSLK